MLLSKVAEDKLHSSQLLKGVIISITEDCFLAFVISLWLRHQFVRKKDITHSLNISLTSYISWTQQSFFKLALSNSTSRVNGSNTPESLLEGCINNQAVTQTFVVKYRAKGQVLWRHKMVMTRERLINNEYNIWFSITVAIIINNFAKQFIRGREYEDWWQLNKVKRN